MRNQPGRSRPTYEPNTQLFKRLLDQSGKSIVDYAHDINCGETTLRKLLAGERVAAETLKSIAEKVKRNWHDLLSDADKERIGLSKVDATESNPIHHQVKPSPLLPAASPTSASRLFQLPAVLADFAGRQKHIADIAGHLRGNAGRTGQSLLHGMGGIGKSSLAVRVAHEVRDQFPDAQLFLDLRGTADGARATPLSPTEAMARVIHAFHPEAIRLPEDQQELEGYYRSVLAGKRALIVLDNAKSEDQVRPLLSAPPSVGFLVTSRTALALDGGIAVQVEMLSVDEAFGLLRRIVGEKGSKTELNRIVLLCGYLPLAIRVAGDFLRLKDDWSVSRYIAALNEERLRWLRIGNDSSKDVEAVLKYFLKTLASANSLFLQGSDGIIGALAKFDANLGNIRNEWRRAMQDMSHDTEAARLCRDFANAGTSILDFRLSLSEQLELLTAAVTSCREIGDRNAEQIALTSLGCARHRNGDFREAVSCHEQSLAIAQDSNNGQAMIASLVNLGNAYLFLGQFQGAIRHYKMSLSFSRGIGHQTGEVNSLTGLGNVYDALGKYRTAIHCHEKSLAVAQDMGAIHAEGIAFTNLGNAYHMIGDYQEAIGCHEKSLAIAQELGERRAEGKALQNLGNAFHFLGKFQDALTFHTQHLELARDMENRLAVCDAVGNLGGVYHSLREYSTAITYHEHHLQLARETNNKQAEGMALGNLGLAHETLGDSHRAIEYFDQHIAIAREFQDHYSEGVASFNLACSHYSLGQRPEAIRWAEYATSVFDANASPNAKAVRLTLAKWRRTS
jgi:tetratricopeptide (TPR) repeat protein